MCTGASRAAEGKISRTRRENLNGIPQSMISRWKSAEEHGYDIDYKALAEKWRQTRAESEKKLTVASDLKVGDVIDPNRMTIKDNASIGKADEHAYWNLKTADGTTSRRAYEAYSDFEITKIEKRKGGIKVTAIFDLGKQSGSRPRIVTVTRIFKSDDKMRKSK